jgi:hypothetical protein
MRAWVDLTVAIHLYSEDRPERFRAAEADLGKALRLRPETADAHVALGLLRLYTNRANQGIAECERGLAIDRNHPHAHALIGLGKNFTGRHEETEAHVVEALRISPHDRRAGMWLMIAASAKLLAGHDEEAIARLSRSIELDPNEPMRHFYLATASAHLGRIEEAREAARVGLELNPGFTIAWHRAARPSDHPAFSRAASVSTKACGRLVCRRNDRDPEKLRRGSPRMSPGIPVGPLSAQLPRPRMRSAVSASRRLCGKTRKMTGRENLDFSRRTSSAQVIVTMTPMGGPHAGRSPARRTPPAEFSFKAVYGRLNCDRREKSSFSTQSVDSRHRLWEVGVSL